MATRQSPLTITAIAGGNLSPFRFVVLAADGQFDHVASAGGDADGVCQSDPAAAGDAIELDVAGVTKVEAGGTVTVGQKIQSDNAGKALTAATGDHVLGKALASGVAGDIIPVLLVSKHILA